MPLDEKARAFLPAGAPVTEFPGMKAPPEAINKYQAYREEEYLKRAGKFSEDILEFFLHEKNKRNYLDDEAIGAIALFTISMRTMYGDPQTKEEHARTWTDADREARYKIFDSICEEMQRYFDKSVAEEKK